jgi:hypothetical protein
MSLAVLGVAGRSGGRESRGGGLSTVRKSASVLVPSWGLGGAAAARCEFGGGVLCLDNRRVRTKTRPGRFRELDGIADHLLPGLIAVLEMRFVFDLGKGSEHELADVGEGESGALGNAALRDGGEDFAENMVDIGGGEEVAGEGGRELFAKMRRFQELLLVAGMEGAEGGVIVLADHAAVAAVSERELAELGKIDFGTFCGHGNLGRKEVMK